MATLRAVETMRARLIDASQHLDGQVPKISIPQICVVGDQSAGKSALLQAVSGVPFPQSTGTCTKVAIVVDMQPQVAGEKDQFSIDNSQFLGRDEVGTAIKERQWELVKDTATGFSDVPMNIKAKTSHRHRLVSVDLPGIIHVASKQDGSVETVKSMIQKYIEPAETLIVVVTPATQDEELATALKLAREADPEGVRTLRVYTKCDVKESTEQHHRLREKLKQAAQEFRHEGNKLAPHFVAVRDTKGVLNAKSEARLLHGLFSLEDSDLCVVGQQNLADRLEPLLSQRISENLDPLRAQIRKARLGAEKELEDIGTNPKTFFEIVTALEGTLSDRARKLEPLLSRRMEEFREAIHETKKEAEDKGKSRETFEECYSVFRSPFFQGESAFTKRMKDICDTWVPIAKCLVQEVSEFVSKAADLSDEAETTLAILSRTFRRGVSHASTAFADKVSAELNESVHRELQKEIPFGTLNHYLTDKYEENTREKAEDIVEALKNLKAVDFKDIIGSYTAEVSGDKVFRLRVDSDLASSRAAECIVKHLSAKKTEHSVKSLKEQQQERVSQAVIAYWWVMHKTFADNVLKAVRDVALVSMREWTEANGLRMALRELQGESIENPGAIKRRNALAATVELMKQCAEDLNKI